MKLLSRTDNDGQPIRILACKRHAPLIVEKWTMLAHRDVHVTDYKDDDQCILCPELVGKR